VPGEVVPADEFYTYADKYLDGRAELLAPAPLLPEQAEEVRALAVAAFDACRCDALARVDFFFEEHGRGFLVNEVNTMPGFTEISMFPRLWELSGVPYPRLVERLVELALERRARRARRAGRPRD
jgi:D-alanine-D-alanine ligase